MTKPSDKAQAAMAMPHGGLTTHGEQSWRNLNTGRLLLGSFERFEESVLAALHAADYGHIRRTHFNVLRHLDAEGTRMSDLAARANLTKAAITALVRSCEGLGLVTIRAGQDDRRSRLVRFTAAGDALMAVFYDTMLAMERRLRDQLGHVAYEGLRASLLVLSEMTEVVAFQPKRQRAGS